MLDLGNYLGSLGISEDIIFLLLALPFISFFVSFSRYYIGLKTFGMYEPLIISYALYIISADFQTGIKFGFPIIILAWLVSEVMRRVLKKTNLHYIAKVSLKISFAGLLFVGALIILSYLGQNGYFTVNPLAIVLILALVESVNLFKVKFGDKRANLVSLETLIIAVVSYFLLSLPMSKVVVLKFPYLVILPIIGSIFIGKWRGLRLSEYLRFKNVKEK